MSIEEIVAYKRPTLSDAQSERLAVVTEIAVDRRYAAQQ